MYNEYMNSDVLFFNLDNEEIIGGPVSAQYPELPKNF